MTNLTNSGNTCLARSAPLGQRMLQMVQLGNLAKPRTDRAELFAKSCRRQNGFSQLILADQARGCEDDARDECS